MYDTICSSPIRVLRLKQLSERFKGHIWAGSTPGEFAAIKQYALVTYSVRSETHCINDHDTLLTVAKELEHQPHWVNVQLMDLDTGALQELSTRVQVTINGSVIN